jgi:hypothetical protein
MKKKKGIFDSCMFGNVYIYKYYLYIIYTIYILYTIDKITETREKITGLYKSSIDCVKSSPAMMTLFGCLHASAHLQFSPVRVTQLIFNSMNNNSKQVDSYTVKRYIDQLLIINWLKFSIIFEEKPLIKKREVAPHENPLE